MEGSFHFIKIENFAVALKVFYFKQCFIQFFSKDTGYFFGSSKWAFFDIWGLSSIFNIFIEQNGAGDRPVHNVSWVGFKHRRYTDFRRAAGL